MLSEFTQKKIKNKFDHGITITSEEDISTVMNQKKESVQTVQTFGQGS